MQDSERRIDGRNKSVRLHREDAAVARLQNSFRSVSEHESRQAGSTQRSDHDEVRTQTLSRPGELLPGGPERQVLVDLTGVRFEQTNERTTPDAAGRSH